ncbi:MAG: hypothetical protein FJ308_05175 [Planctomycetes bacterium]|nr:hypothetical protein [Planctomycetota bacterium]
MNSSVHRISLAKAWRSDGTSDTPGDQRSIARVFHAPPSGIGTSRILLVIARDTAAPANLEAIFLNDKFLTWCTLETPIRWDITESILPTNRLKVVVGNVSDPLRLVTGASTQFGLNVWLEILEP